MVICHLEFCESKQVVVGNNPVGPILLCPTGTGRKKKVAKSYSHPRIVKNDVKLIPVSL